MPFLSVNKGVAFVVVDGVTIFLSLRKNRFYALPSDIADAFRAAIDGKSDLDAHEQAALSPLIASGLLHRTQSAFKQNALPPIATAGPPPDLPGVPTRLVLGAGVTRSITWRLLQARQLSVMLQHLSLMPWVAPCAETSELAWSIAEAHRRSSAVSTMHDRCLSDAIALAWALRRRRVDASFMIGVRTSPFEAHSWVQHRDRVLTDLPEHIRKFTPILAI